MTRGPIAWFTRSATRKRSKPVPLIRRMALVVSGAFFIIDSDTFPMLRTERWLASACVAHHFSDMLHKPKLAHDANRGTIATNAVSPDRVRWRDTICRVRLVSSSRDPAVPHRRRIGSLAALALRARVTANETCCR
jgi:hypothetical protein